LAKKTVSNSTASDWAGLYQPQPPPSTLKSLQSLSHIYFLDIYLLFRETTVYLLFHPWTGLPCWASNKTLALFVSLSLYARECLTPKGQDGLRWSWYPLATQFFLSSHIFGVANSSSLTLTCSVGGCQNNQQNSETELAFWKFKAASLLPVALCFQVAAPGPLNFSAGWLPPRWYTILYNSMELGRVGVWGPERDNSGTMVSDPQPSLLSLGSSDQLGRHPMQDP
jgi:hypothetical protein